MPKKPLILVSKLDFYQWQVMIFYNVIKIITKQILSK